MAKKSFKKPNYKSAVTKNVEKQRTEGRSYGYLNLPNGVGLFRESKETLNKKGRVLLDIIPYVITNKHHADLDPEVGIEVGSLWYRSPFKVHRGIGAGDGETVVCPTTFGLPCPICEHRKKRMTEGADKEEIKALAPSKRNLYAIIPKGVKDVDEKIHIWNTTDYFVQECINQELEENEDMACFPDLEDGFSLNFRFEEESFAGNKYYKPSRLDFEERDPYDEDILDDVPELDECLSVLSYKELSSLLFQIEPEDVEDQGANDPDDDEDEKPIRRKKTVEKEEEDEKPIRRNKKPEPEPEPEPEEDDDDEDDTPPPPKKKNNAKAQEFINAAKKRGVPMDDDDDEDDDEDEKPRAKTGKKEEKPAAKSGKGKCPFGHTFGEDNDAYPKDCKKCDVWDDCFDAQ